MLMKTRIWTCVLPLWTEHDGDQPIRTDDDQAQLPAYTSISTFSIMRR